MKQLFLFIIFSFFIFQSFSFAQEKEKLSINLKVENSFKESNNSGNVVSSALNENKDSVFHENINSNTNSKELNTNIDFSLSYNIDSMNEFSFSTFVSRHTNSSNIFTNQRKKDFILENNFTTSYTASDIYNYNSNFYSFSANYKHKFNNKGHNLSIFSKANFSNSLSEGTNIRIYNDPSYIYIGFHGLDCLETNARNLELNILYTLPYNKNGKISLGLDLKNDLDKKNSDYNYFDSLNYVYNIKDYAFSYIYNYDNKQLGSQIAWQHKFNNLILQANLNWNLRKVAFNYLSDYSPDDTSYLKSIIKPSLCFNYRLNAKNELNFSYFLQNNTPSPRDITNHKLYGGDIFSIGNKKLKDSYTHFLKATWKKSFTQNLLFEINAYYKHSFNEIAYVTDFILDDYFEYWIAYTKPYNLKESYQYGLKANVDWNFGKYINTQFNADLFNNYYEIDYPKTDLYSHKSISYTFDFKISVLIFKNYQLYASAHYLSPYSKLFYESKENYFLNCGASAELLKGRLSLFLDIYDLFNLSKHEFSNTNPYFITFNSNKYDTRFVKFGLIFRIKK